MDFGKMWDDFTDAICDVDWLKWASLGLAIAGAVVDITRTNDRVDKLVDSRLKAMAAEAEAEKVIGEVVDA